jgi:hypothetical protein
MFAGVQAQKRAGAIAAPRSPAASISFPALAGVTAATSRALNQGVGVRSGVEFSLDPNAANVSTSFGVSGLAALVGALVALWALDRYVVDVPGIGRGR